ncbi:hypothetical protein EQG79_00470 [Spirosoma sordidisoli]|uniref:Uncharacterized protein n=1 Tax=Spirosoma sordidisoli TaxID=2502893 RepID=A0A4V1RWL2_9BACT|nr:hypothetical protein EQG79_00470 [Spirosoma sordidisoli]
MIWLTSCACNRQVLVPDEPVPVPVPPVPVPVPPVPVPVPDPLLPPFSAMILICSRMWASASKHENGVNGTGRTGELNSASPVENPQPPGKTEDGGEQPHGVWLQLHMVK